LRPIFRINRGLDLLSFTIYMGKMINNAIGQPYSTDC